MPETKPFFPQSEADLITSPNQTLPQLCRNSRSVSAAQRGGLDSGHSSHSPFWKEVRALVRVLSVFAAVAGNLLAEQDDEEQPLGVLGRDKAVFAAIEERKKEKALRAQLISVRQQ